MIIRFAEPGEGTVINELFRDSLGITFRALPDRFDKGGFVVSYELLECVLVAEDDGQIVAGLLAGPPKNMLESLPPDMAGDASQLFTKLSAIAVAPASRGKNIGSKLLVRCVNEYRRRDYAWMYGQFEKSTHLADFYSAHGFNIHRPGQDMIAPYIAGLTRFKSTSTTEQWFDLLLNPHMEQDARQMMQPHFNDPHRPGASFGL